MSLELLIRLVPLIITAALSFAVAWTLQGYRIEEAKDMHTAYMIEIAKLAEKAQAENLARERRWALEREEAELESIEREKILKAHVAAASAANRSLRDELSASSRRMSVATVETCRAYADAIADVLGACSDEYRSVAAEADQCVSDVEKLSEAWPK